MSTEIHNDDNAVWWEGPLAIDADGAPNAYGPNGGLDYLANAGGPGNWYGVVTDAAGDPIVQGASDPCPGSYVSTTALVDPSKAKIDPNRYVDSSRVCYVSVPSDAVHDYGLHVGDVALVYCRKTGQTSAAVVADVGPRNKWGEGSIALASALGLPSSPKNGGATGGIVVVVFKGSHKGWPRNSDDIAQQTQDLLNALGGPVQYGIE